MREKGHNQFAGYKVGDQVWSLRDQMWWTITDVRESEYRFKVEGPLLLSPATAFITVNGIERGIQPTFFCQPFEIPDSAFERPLPDLQVDDRVLVLDNTDVWLKRHFKEWGPDGWIKVWYEGRTSFTANGCGCAYTQYKLPEDE